LTDRRSDIISVIIINEIILMMVLLIHGKEVSMNSNITGNQFSIQVCNQGSEFSCGLLYRFFLDVKRGVLGFAIYFFIHLLTDGRSIDGFSIPEGGEFYE